jgi:hypothetical protein
MCDAVFRSAARVQLSLCGVVGSYLPTLAGTHQLSGCNLGSMIRITGKLEDKNI